MHNLVELAKIPNANVVNQIYYNIEIKMNDYLTQYIK